MRKMICLGFFTIAAFAFIGCTSMKAEREREPANISNGGDVGDRPATIGSAAFGSDDISGNRKLEKALSEVDKIGERILSTRPIFAIIDSDYTPDYSLQFELAADGTCQKTSLENLGDYLTYKPKRLQTPVATKKCAAFQIREHLKKGLKEDTSAGKNIASYEGDNTWASERVVLRKDQGCIGIYELRRIKSGLSSILRARSVNMQISFIPTKQQCMDIAADNEERALIERTFSHYLGE